MNRSFKKYIPLTTISSMVVSSCKDKRAAEEQANREQDRYSTFGKTNYVYPDQYKLSEIQTGAIELRNLSNIIKLTGAIEAEPNSIATVSAPLGGYIKTAGLLPGQAVKKGSN
jgi:cobalt-zinc-cadmium efflux system membrane fusion protein